MIPERSFTVSVYDAGHNDKTHTGISVTPDEEDRHSFEAGLLTWNVWHELSIIDASILARLATELTWEIIEEIPNHSCLVDNPLGSGPRFQCEAGGKVVDVVELITDPDPPMEVYFVVPTDRLDYWLARIDDVLTRIAVDDQLAWPDGYRFTDPWLDPR